jgi:hypothetical protein
LLYEAANLIDQLPAQTQRTFPIHADRRYTKPFPRQIPWWLAEVAYGAYSSRYGTEQSLDVLAYRGGFAPVEMDMFVPDWLDRLDRAAQGQQQAEALAKLTDNRDAWCTLAEQAQQRIHTLIARAEQAEAALRGVEHEQRLIDADTRRGITDGSTPLFQRVRNIVEQLERVEAALSALDGKDASV